MFFETSIKRSFIIFDSISLTAAFATSSTDTTPVFPVGYKIISNNKSIIYLPDIDSWDQWDIDILDVIRENDVLFLDGTFYNKNEIKHRNIEEIPHPSILDSMDRFQNLDVDHKKKIYFTHLNHTNNLLRKDSEEFKNIFSNGYNIANDGQEVSI